MKHHKNEVEEALQFDPTLRSEIEYDLKQFERAKKDKLVGKCHFTSNATFLAGSSALLSLNLYLSNLFAFSIAAINAQASARKSPHFPSSVAAAPGTASRLSFSSRKSLSPYLDLQTLPAQSIVKPSLRKSLGGQASRGRTPYDALKSPGMHLARSAIRSALSNTAGIAGLYYVIIFFSLCFPRVSLKKYLSLHLEVVKLPLPCSLTTTCRLLKF